MPFLLQERVAGGGPLTPSNAGVQVRAVPRNCEYVLFLLPSLTCLLVVAFLLQEREEGAACIEHGGGQRWWWRCRYDLCCV